MIDRAFDFGDLIWGDALRRPLFLEVAVGSEHTATMVRRDWAALREPEHKSCAPWVARFKAFEGMVRGDPNGITVGPTEDIQGSGLKGWVRVGQQVAAASAQSDDEDLLAALLMSLSRAGYSSQLHHVGFSYRTLEEMLTAVDADEEETGNPSSWPDARDLVRAYTWRRYDETINGGYWVERIYRPPTVGLVSAMDRAIHVDLMTLKATEVLEFVAAQLGIVAEMFDPPWPNGPVGSVFGRGRDVPVGVMTRKDWWNIPMVIRPRREELDLVVRQILADRVTLAR